MSRFDVKFWVCVVVSAALVCWLSYAVPAAACAEIGREMGAATKYRPLTGCYVQVEGRWVREERHRNVEED